MKRTVDDELLLAELVDKFMRDVEDGAAPSVSEYVARYPQLASILETVLPAVGTIRANSKEMEPAVLPTRIGCYRIVRELARGGMGVVLEAFQEPLERLVALKLVDASRSDGKRSERFLQEGRLVARLSHPNVVTVYDAGSWDRYHYLALELLDGSDLRRHVEAHGPMSITEAIDAVQQAAQGLEHAHSCGIVHRDIKPSNLFRDAQGTVKVLDLGLGLVVRHAGETDSDLTRSHDVLGTFDYMAPEQLHNARDVDRRADVYSLGCTFFFLLTGTTIRAAGDRAQELLTEKIGDLNAAKAWYVLQRFTAFEPSRRPADMQAFQEDLRTLSGALRLDAELKSSIAPTCSPPAISDSPTVVAVRSERVGPKVSKPILGLIALATALAFGAIYFAIRHSGEQAASRQADSLTEIAKGEFQDRQGMSFVLMPAGEFVMGTNEKDTTTIKSQARAVRDAAAVDWEAPQRVVRITRPFYLGRYEVTVGEFQQFVEQEGYVTDAEKSAKGGQGRDPIKELVGGKNFHWRNTGWEQSDRHPVVNVSWNDAVAFCDWKSRMEGAQYRLPTEAEWEYACSRDQVTVVNSAEADDSFPFTAPVGSFGASQDGLYDLRGNAWEWCADWFAPTYDAADLVDPQGPPQGDRKVARGGSWNSSKTLTRAACRAGFSQPSAAGYGTGFRVVREL